MKKTTENGVIVLHAEVGMKLTNGKVFGDTIRLGLRDTTDNWYEITEDEAEQMLPKYDDETDELTETEQKAAAYDIITGVSE